MDLTKEGLAEALRKAAELVEENEQPGYALCIDTRKSEDIAAQELYEEADMKDYKTFTASVCAKTVEKMCANGDASPEHVFTPGFLNIIKDDDDETGERTINLHNEETEVRSKAKELFDSLSCDERDSLLFCMQEWLRLFLDKGVGAEELFDESYLDAWAEDNGWKHPDKDSIDDFTDGMPGCDVRDWVVEYVSSNLS